LRVCRRSWLAIELFISRMAAENKASKIIIIIPLSISSLRLRGITSPEKTAEGYELRSRGPASQGFGALDNLVSRSRRSSPTRSAHSSTAAAPHTSPPPSPQYSTDSVLQPATMVEPSMQDVMEMLKSITTKMSTMEADMAAMKEKSASTSEYDVGGRAEVPRDLDRPPKFHKLDFPRYDSKSDPMLFINKCESYFRQQHTMAEERVWMVSYNLEDVAHLWYIQLQEDEGTPPWGRFKDLLNLRFGPPLRSAPLYELAECRRTGTVEEYAN
jgi:hypothetical protein